MKNIRLNRSFLFTQPFAFYFTKVVGTLNGLNSGGLILMRTFDVRISKISTPDNDKSGEDFKKTFFLYSNCYLVYIDDHSCGDYEYYPGYMTDMFCSLIQLDSTNLSGDELNYSFKILLEQIKEGLALLDREGVGYDTLLRSVLDSSQALNNVVNAIEFHMDILKSIRKLLIKHVVLNIEHAAVTSRIEMDIAYLYTRLQSVIGREAVRQYLLVSPELSLNAHSLGIRKQLVGIVEDDILLSYRNPTGLNRTRPPILLSIREKGSSEHLIANLVTVETTSSAFSNIFDKSIAYRYSDEMFEQELNGRLEEAKVFLCSCTSTLEEALRDQIGKWTEDAKTPGLSFSTRSVARSVRTTLSKMQRIHENGCGSESFEEWDSDDDDSYDHHHRNHNDVIVDDDDDDNDDDSGSSGTGGGSCSVQKRYIDLEN